MYPNAKLPRLECGTFSSGGRISATLYEIFQLGLSPSIIPRTPFLRPGWIRVVINGNAIPIGLIPILVDTIVGHRLKLVRICSMMKRTAGAPRGA